MGIKLMTEDDIIEGLLEATSEENAGSTFKEDVLAFAKANNVTVPVIAAAFRKSYEDQSKPYKDWDHFQFLTGYLEGMVGRR